MKKHIVKGTENLWKTPTGLEVDVTRPWAGVSLKFGAGGHLDLTGGHPSVRPFGPAF